MSSRERPILVVGSERSGTTLLQSLLGAHPRIVAPPELHYWFRIASSAAYWGDLSQDEALERVVRATLEPPVPLLAEYGLQVGDIVDRVKSSERTYAGVLDAVMRALAERAGKSRWSEKSPGQPPGPMWRLFPDAQVLHVVRDPRDVVASSLQTPWVDPNPWLLARSWRRFNLDAIAAGTAAGPDRYLRIRYEDLTRDPATVMRQVFSFLDEEFDPAYVSDAQARTKTVAAAAAPWQSRVADEIAPRGSSGRLSRWTHARVAAVVGDLLRPLGYPPARHRTVLVGRVLNVLLLPRAAGAGRQWLRGWRARNDPAAQVRLKDAYMRQGAARVGTPST